MRYLGQLERRVDNNFAGVVSDMFKVDAHDGPVVVHFKTIRPLDDDDGGFGEDIFQAKSVEVARAFDAIEVNVVDRD